MSRRVNFFVGVRLCNLINETAPLPQFCVIFLNISLFREMMLEKNTKICVIRRTHCLIVNWRTRPLWLDKCVWDERSARQKTRLKKQLTLSVTWSTFDHFHVQVVIRTFQCFTDWYVDLERTIKLLCKSRIMQFGRLNCATSAGLCNLSQYLPISREKLLTSFTLRHTIFALFVDAEQFYFPTFWGNFSSIHIHRSMFSERSAALGHNFFKDCFRCS